MPPGRPGIPAVILPSFCADVSSATRSAALKAAATKSSSMSLSSASKLGSMVTRRTSCLQVMVTLTRPEPDSPLTSILPSSSWAFFMLSCMAWACFIRPASCPLLNMEVSFGLNGLGLKSELRAVGWSLAPRGRQSLSSASAPAAWRKSVVQPRLAARRWPGRCVGPDCRSHGLLRPPDPR